MTSPEGLIKFYGMATANIFFASSYSRFSGHKKSPTLMSEQ
jgi:hypothetical protein